MHPTLYSVHSLMDGLHISVIMEILWWYLSGAIKKSYSSINQWINCGSIAMAGLQFCIFILLWRGPWLIRSQWGKTSPGIDTTPIVFDRSILGLIPPCSFQIPQYLGWHHRPWVLDRLMQHCLQRHRHLIHRLLGQPIPTTYLGLQILFDTL